MIILPATVMDLPEIVALDVEADRPWTEASWRSQLLLSHALTLVAHGMGGEALGMAAFQVAGDVADLLRISVKPEVRQLGIGRALVSAGVEWALGHDAERLLLEVAPDNTPALSLYRSMGFTDLSVRPDYYGPGSDAAVMQKDLAAVDEWELTGGLS